MFEVAEPLIALDSAAHVAKVSVLNKGVQLSKVNIRLGQSIKRNRTKRKRSAARAKQTMKY